MKRVLSIVGLGVLFASNTAVAAVGALGIEAGVNFGNATTPTQISSDTRTGFSVGVNADIPLGGAFSVQPELVFSQRGTSLVDSTGVRVRTSFDSLSLPVMLKAKLGERVGPYLFLGPVVTYNIGRKVEAEVAGTTANFTFQPAAWDFGLAGGIGIDIGPFFANARYNLGLVDIDESGASFKSRGFQLLAGLRFGG